MGDQDKPPSNADDWRSRRPQTWQGWVYRLGLVAFVMAMIVLTVFYHQLWGFYVAIAVIAADHFAFRRKPKSLQAAVSAPDPDAPNESQKKLIKNLSIVGWGVLTIAFILSQATIILLTFGFKIEKNEVINSMTIAAVLFVVSPIIVTPALFLNGRRLQMPLRKGWIVLIIPMFALAANLYKAYIEFPKDWRFALPFAMFGILILSITLAVSWPVGDKKPRSASTP